MPALVTTDPKLHKVKMVKDMCYNGRLLFLTPENVLRLKLCMKKKQRRNRMKRTRKMKSLVGYGSNLSERIALLCGWVMHAVKGGISRRH